MNSFLAIVALARAARSARVVGDDLHLELVVSDDIKAIEDRVDKPMVVCVADRILHGGLRAAALGDVATVRIMDVAGDEFHVAQTFSALLRYRGGAFQSRVPAGLYVVEGDICSCDPLIVDRQYHGYMRALELCVLLNAVADVPVSGGSKREAVFIGSKKLVIPIRYEATDLIEMPSSALIESLRDELVSPPHVARKQLVFKNVITRLLESADEVRRFGRLAARLSGVSAAFHADYEAFVTEFNFDKRREEVGRRRLHFLQRLTQASSEIWSKLLAIPIGQAVVVSQYRNSAEFALSNTALALASVVFTIIGIVFVATLRNSLQDIKLELESEQADLGSRYPLDEIRTEFKPVFARLTVYGAVLPRLVVLLLLLGVAFSLFAFVMVPPGDLFLPD